MDIEKMHFLKLLPFFIKKFRHCSRKLLQGTIQGTIMQLKRQNESGARR